MACNIFIVVEIPSHFHREISLHVEISNSSQINFSFSKRSFIEKFEISLIILLRDVN